MKKILFTITAFVIVLSVFISCKPTSSFYYENNKVNVGKLSDSTYTEIRRFLLNHTDQALRDTILVKYDFNNDRCWNRLDQRDDNHIKRSVDFRNDRIKKILESRKDITILTFREPGDNVNKVISKNESIKVVRSKLLLDMFFEKRYECGSSIAIMPDKRFVVFYGDSHSQILDLTKSKFQDIIGSSPILKD
jgi:hypothetical protein